MTSTGAKVGAGWSGGRGSGWVWCGGGGVVAGCGVVRGSGWVWCGGGWGGW